jgi:hypothetical protein
MTGHKPPAVQLMIRRRPNAAGWPRGVVFFLLFAGAAYGSFLISSHHPEQRSPPERLAIPASALDFGELLWRPTFQLKLPVQNVSDAEIRIELLQTSCSCLSVAPDRLINIPCSGTLEIEAILDLLDVLPPESASDEKDVAVRISAVLQDGQVQNWVVHGRVRRPWRMLPPLVDFGTRTEEELGMADEGATHHVAVVTGTDTPDELALAKNEVAAYVEVSVAQSDGRPSVGLRLRPEAPGGYFEGLVWIADGSTSGPSAAVPLRLRGRIVSDIVVIPATVYVKADSSSSAEIVLLQSRAGQTFVVEKVITSSDAIEVRAEGKDAGHCRRFHIVIRDVHCDNDAPPDVVSFHVRDVAGRARTVDVDIRREASDHVAS